MPKRKITQIRLRKKVPPLKNSYRHKFDELKESGDSFTVSGDVNCASIRAQASKQGKRRGAVYEVSQTENGSVIVRLARLVNNNAGKEALSARA